MPRRVVQLTVSQYVNAEPGRDRSGSHDGQPDDVNITDGGDAFQRERGPSGCDRRPRSPAPPDPFVDYAQALELRDVGDQSTTQSYEHTWFAPVGACRGGRPVEIHLRGRQRGSCTFATCQRRCARPGPIGSHHGTKREFVKHLHCQIVIFWLACGTPRKWARIVTMRIRGLGRPRWTTRGPNFAGE